MAHCKKFRLTDSKRVFDEVYRTADSYRNCVDPARRGLDYVIDNDLGVRMLEEASDVTGESVAKDLKERVKPLRYRKQHNTVGVCNWVVTCPEEFKDKPEMQARFFRTVYSYTLQRYGENNVLLGCVHNDETSPHIHIPVIPVIEGNHLCASKFLVKRELASYQNTLEQVCEREFGIKGLILNGRTKGNYTLEELKQRTKDEEDLKNRREAVREREREASRMEIQAREHQRRAEKYEEEAAESKRKAKEYEQRAKQYELQAVELVKGMQEVDKQFRALADELREEVKNKYIQKQARFADTASKLASNYKDTKARSFQK